MRFQVLAGPMLVALAQAVEVTFYSGRDCNANDQIAYLEVADSESGGGVERTTFDDVKPVSMLVIGWATVLLTNPNIGDCAYCANYYTQSGVKTNEDGCVVDDGQKCVNIETGWGPDAARLIANGEPNPADIACRNHQDRCDFPFPYNGFCAQS